VKSPAVERTVPCLVGDADGWPSEWSVPMFWVYWDTAWSIILSGIMVATILAHPDAEFAEVTQQRANSPWRGRDM
jgi:hypothetical protein